MSRSHHGIYDAVLEKDELRDHDRHKDLKKAKFTFTECILAILLALTFVTLSAEFLVNEIEHMVFEYGISDSFMGLVRFAWICMLDQTNNLSQILVPLVEKVAEHL